MHMLMVILGGVVLLGLFLLFGQLWGTAPASLVTAAKIFVPVWLCVAIVNLWVGVSKAGYTIAQELPILLLVFAIPALLALAAIWHFSRS